MPNPDKNAAGNSSVQLPGPGMPISSTSAYGAGGGNLQEAMLLALNDLTISATNVFDVGDLPPEPAPPQKVDAPGDLPRPPVTNPPILPTPKPDAPLLSSYWPWLLSAAALLSAVAGYVWHRFYARRQRRLLDVPLFRPARAENPPDGDEIQPSPAGLSMEELEHGYRQ
jgi:hypothetical protein